VPPSVPSIGEVVLRMHAVGLNRSDISVDRQLSAMSKVRNYGFGIEGTGTVELLGPGVDSYWLGKRVCTMPTDEMRGYGLLAERAIAPVSALIEPPDGFSDAECSGIWSPFLLGYAALIDAAHICSGDCAVILSCDTSVKIACLQVAKTEGAAVVTVAHDRSSKSELMKWGADFVIERTTDANVLRGLQMTGHGRKTVVVSDVDYQFPREAHDSARPETKLIWVTPHDSPQDIGSDQSSQKIQSCSISTITQNPEKLIAATRYIYDRLRFGFLHAAIGHKFDFSEVNDAFALLESGKAIGKIVVTFSSPENINPA
jgi:NADPH:quinone reductase-like Zn-dependent oxidoreductase